MYNLSLDIGTHTPWHYRPKQGNKQVHHLQQIYLFWVYRWLPTSSRFFDFMTAWKRHPFCRNCSSNFESGSVPRVANVLHPLSWFWAVATQCPRQPHNHEINEQHNEDHSGFHFQFSIQSVTGYSTLLGNRLHVRWSCPTVGWCKGCKHIYHGWGQRWRSQVYSIPFWLNDIFNLQ